MVQTKTEKQLSKITLTLPPSDNRLRHPIITNNGGALLKPTSAYSDWKSIATGEWLEWCIDNNALKFAPHQPTFSNQYEYKVEIFLPSKRPDITNFIKAVKDFLEKKLYSNDRYVNLSIKMPVLVDKDHPRIVVDPNPVVYNVS